MNWNPLNLASDENAEVSSEGSIFSIRGSLDGDDVQDFTEKEQFIGFMLQDEQFLLPIAAVSEIIMLAPITFVPQGPTFIEGVINLRGEILPAINLRKIFSLPRITPTLATRIIIVKVDDIRAGLIVDSITYVYSLLPGDIEAENLTSGSQGAELITRICKQGDRILGIIDSQKTILLAAGPKGLEGDNPEESAHV